MKKETPIPWRAPRDGQRKPDWKSFTYSEAIREMYANAALTVELSDVTQNKLEATRTAKRGLLRVMESEDATPAEILRAGELLAALDKRY